MSLESDIERLFVLGAEALNQPNARARFAEFRDALTAGRVRAAEKVDGRWTVRPWVKRGILLGFRMG